tara:strand:+ start:72 stop:374 length:303 start_codon:yes stop_codon:yes gene_type:complete
MVFSFNKYLNGIENGNIRSILRNVVLEESNMDMLAWSHYSSLGRTSWIRKSTLLIFLLLTSCAYHTEIPCPFGLTMKQVDEKCDFIYHGSTSKWVLKKKK